MIKAWSYSRLTDFEQCPFKAKLKYLDKIPEPERPLPPGKTEHANDRGTRVHEAAETFVKRPDVQLIDELKHFAPEFQIARKLHALGKVAPEAEWGYDKDWNPTGWFDRDTWCRIKTDLPVMLSPTEALVIDYKTGKRFGNEVKHAEQTQLYALGAALRYPKLEKIHTELWYTDQNELTRVTYTKLQALAFIKSYTARGTKMTTAITFQPAPNIHNCRWCPYKRAGGTGHCEVGV